MEWDMLKLLVLPCDGYNKFVFPQLTFLLFATNSKTYLPVTEYNLTFTLQVPRVRFIEGERQGYVGNEDDLI